MSDNIIVYPRITLAVDIVNKLKDSVAYWRQYIPEDGMRLDQIAETL